MKKMANGIVLNKEISNQSFELDEIINMFLQELKSFVEQYDYLGSVRYEEYREFNHIEHDYYIKNIHNMSPIDLIPTINDEWFKESLKIKSPLDTKIGIIDWIMKQQI